MKKLLILLFSCFTISLSAQEKLRFHTESIDRLFEWFDKEQPQNEISTLSKIPANQIMEQLFMLNQKDVPLFTDVLNRYSRQETDSLDSYQIQAASKLKDQIYSFVNKVTEPSYSEELYHYVLGYFPAGYTLTSPIDVYFTATGWEWGDAMVFNYKKDNGRYIVNKGNNTAIIFNATLICSIYGETTEQQAETFKKVFSHETFHFMLHQLMEKSNNSFFASTNIQDQAIFKLFDEGIAHYIADHVYIKEKYTSNADLKEIEQRNFSQFAVKMKSVFNPDESMEIREGMLEEGLYGKYWDKYVCITGLFMAYHIEQYNGMDALKKCIATGPLQFIREYELIRHNHRGLPELPQEIIEYLKKE